MDGNSKIVVAAVMPECRCVVAYHIKPLSMSYLHMSDLVRYWVKEGFEAEILSRLKISHRLGCPHRENWPRNTHAAPIGAMARAEGVIATLGCMQGLAGEEGKSGPRSGNYYSYIDMYRNQLTEHK